MHCRPWPGHAPLENLTIAPWWILADPPAPNDVSRRGPALDFLSKTPGTRQACTQTCPCGGRHSRRAQPLRVKCHACCPRRGRIASPPAARSEPDRAHIFDTVAGWGRRSTRAFFVILKGFLRRGGGERRSSAHRPPPGPAASPRGAGPCRGGAPHLGFDAV